MADRAEVMSGNTTCFPDDGTCGTYDCPGCAHYERAVDKLCAEVARLERELSAAQADLAAYRATGCDFVEEHNRCDHDGDGSCHRGVVLADDDEVSL